MLCILYLKSTQKNNLYKTNKYQLIKYDLMLLPQPTQIMFKQQQQQQQITQFRYGGSTKER